MVLHIKDINIMSFLFMCSSFNFYASNLNIFNFSFIVYLWCHAWKGLFPAKLREIVISIVHLILSGFYSFRFTFKPLWSAVVFVLVSVTLCVSLTL